MRASPSAAWWPRSWPSGTPSGCAASSWPAPPPAGRAVPPIRCTSCFELSPEERSAVRMQLIDSRWDEAWQRANPDMVRLLSERMRLEDQADTPAGLTNQLAARAEHDTAGRLGSISCPTLVCGGRFDGSLPRRPTASSWPDAIPGARLEMFDGGHRLLHPGRRGAPGCHRVVPRPRTPTHRVRRAVDCLAWTSPRHRSGGRWRRTTRRSRRRHLRELFADDPERAGRLTAGAADLVLDYSKHRVTDETMRLLMDVARAGRRRSASRRDVRRRAHQHDRGPRRPARRPAHAAGHRARSSTARTSWATCTPSSTRWGSSPTASATAPGAAPPASASPPSSTSASAAPTSGPAMATAALADYAQPGSPAASCPTSTRSTSTPPRTTSTPPPTLFVVSSKTFTTLETLTNAAAARDWLLRRAGRRGGRRRRGQALRRRLDQRQGGGRVRHRHRQHARVLGLGRRPLLLRLGHRLLAHGRHRAGRPSARCWPASTSIDEHFRTAPARARTSR